MLLNTPICEFNWQAPAFSLTDTDGAPHSLSSLMGPNGLLLAFICNHCPYVQAIIDRLVDDCRRLQAEGIGVAAIMPNDYQHYVDDSPEKMKIFAAAHRFSFPYLIDETQDVAKAYRAVCTPDFFGFNKDGGLQYRGRLDAYPTTSHITADDDSRQAELLEAMCGVARTGTGPVKQTPSMGCSIKWR